MIIYSEVGMGRGEETGKGLGWGGSGEDTGRDGGVEGASRGFVWSKRGGKPNFSLFVFSFVKSDKPREGLLTATTCFSQIQHKSIKKLKGKRTSKTHKPHLGEKNFES